MSYTKTHLAVALLSIVEQNKSLEKHEILSIFEKTIPYVILPDTLRYYGFGFTVPRLVTHFAINPTTHRSSLMRYPIGDELKNLTKKTAKSLIISAEDESTYLPLGVNTVNPASFVFTNLAHHSGEKEYYWILSHLQRDFIHDKAISRIFDFSHLSEDGFIDSGSTTYSTLSFRIAYEDICEYEFRYVVRLLAKHGYTFDEDFMENFIFPVIDMAYSKDLAENTRRLLPLPHVNYATPTDEEEIKNIVHSMIHVTKSYPF